MGTLHYDGTQCVDSPLPPNCIATTTVSNYRTSIAHWIENFLQRSSEPEQLPEFLITSLEKSVFYQLKFFYFFY